MKKLMIANKLEIMRLIFLLIITYLSPVIGFSQSNVYTEVDFTDSLRPWHGLGFNYVEAAQPSFSAIRTSDDEKYLDVGKFKIKNARISYQAPGRSVTTFYQN